MLNFLVKSQFNGNFLCQITVSLSMSDHKKEVTGNPHTKFLVFTNTNYK